MDTRTKVVCIKEPEGQNYYRLKIGQVYYMSSHWMYNTIENYSGTEIKREVTGYYIYEDNSNKTALVNPEIYNECFITFDEWREKQLNTILDDNT